MNRRHVIYLAFGSNLGDRMGYLRQALHSLPPAVEVEACSAVYETPPWGIVEQPVFYNQVVRAVTDLSPQQLLTFLKHIEQRLGRTETVRNGPRVIDIDILFYDDIELTTPELEIPHPRIEGRAFVWVPLAEIAPELVYPKLGKTAAQIVGELDCSGIRIVSL
ncbi:MAG: 2-amino-4-hydroxy-6-hydroxymethyldihydropteridine diphosphokinase [Anaerolineales bacterium]|nr:2-amino-4-hydroxy-6-hydroxymethyldihydropteridine diphosphokinase [Anaerolineales bacterium]MDW8162484.1 2-amino-4-hydroxy-6-hydroxymethyldihydropteridine diphosphokinase [Anaerolineales bacterium]